MALALSGAGTNGTAADPSIEPQFLSNVRQVTSGFEKAGEGYFSPDGKTIIYQAVPLGYPFYQIYSQSAPLTAASEEKTAAQLPRIISTGRGRTTCAYFAPDGKSLIFASSHLDPKLKETEDKSRQQQAEDKKSGKRRRYQWDFDPAMEIFRANLDGSGLTRLTNSPGYDAECAYSPDGKQIVFCSDRDGDPDLYIMDADGGNVRQLTNTPGYDGGPFFSPDGRWIVFRSDRKQENFLQIMAIGVDGKHETALTNNVGVNWAPYWHPTEPYIIWTGADHSNLNSRPNYDLWMTRYEITPDGVQPVGPKIRLTDNAAADVLPVFSPDGRKLMWTSSRSDGHTSQLWIADFNLPKN
ncbi:MAG: biopolymer transporter Tol [Planctomycetes bacterium]|nr:biopolymer transporter Tol [Planctomycetota bacterium]